MTRKQREQHHQNEPDLAAQSSRIGIDAVAASARYQYGRHDVNAGRHPPAGPVVEEVLFVERRLMLKEEIHIRRVRTTEHHQQKIMLRHQEAVVSRFAA